MSCRVQYLLENYSGEKIVEVIEDVERSGEFEEHTYWKLYHACTTDRILPVIDHQGINERNGQLNFRMRQRIRHLAQKLKSTAESLYVRPGSALLSIERAILLNEGLNHDEMQVVRSIHSLRTPTTVSMIAQHLKKYMSSRTFHAALRYLSYSATTVPEELALACELIKVTYPIIKESSYADSVYNLINGFIEDKLDKVLH